jgi:NAD(P)-dependent dehydrogenase (short-subunit alcohol dehydrogenase family)
VRLLTSFAIGVAGAVVSAEVRRRRRAREQWFGKVVLITGGSRGLGLVLARELALRGAKLALLARDLDALKEARTTIHPLAPVSLVPADVTCQAEDAVDQVIRTFGRLDVLINNAGAMVSAPFADTSDRDYEEALAVHFWGTLHMTRAALPHLERCAGARVINICSVEGRIGVPHLSAYCAGRFAQAGLSQVLTHELRERGIAVTTVYPGLTGTGLHLNAPSNGHARQAACKILRGVARGAAQLVIPVENGQGARPARLRRVIGSSEGAAVTSVAQDHRGAA